MSTCILTTGAPKRIGFISTRFHGTDGVTLEARKWAHILRGMGHCCFWMAGLLDAPPEVSHTAPLAFFGHPAIADLQRKLFGVTFRPRAVTNQIQSLKEKLKDELYRFVERFRLEVLVPENILAIPMHVPLGLAMTEVIAETTIPVIAHHHDFAWERERFTLNCVGDCLQAAFPPLLHRMEHVVINSMQQKELARRLGIPSQVIPNVLDFETPPRGGEEWRVSGVEGEGLKPNAIRRSVSGVECRVGMDEYNRDLRREIGLRDDDWFILQPTRVVQRKGIEHAIELVRRLKSIGNRRSVLVISHPAGDEGSAYMAMLNDRIADAGIDVRFIADRVGETRGTNAEGRKIYTLSDVYPHADLITYPSHYEGFGNAFLEAIFFGKPVVVNTYAVYARDINPLGFKTIELTQLVTKDVVEQVHAVLQDQQMREDWARTNYGLGLKYFSYAVARRKLAARLANLFGEGV